MGVKKSQKEEITRKFIVPTQSFQNRKLSLSYLSYSKFHQTRRGLSTSIDGTNMETDTRTNQVSIFKMTCVSYFSSPVVPPKPCFPPFPS